MERYSNKNQYSSFLFIFLFWLYPTEKRRQKCSSDLSFGWKYVIAFALNTHSSIYLMCKNIWISTQMSFVPYHYLYVTDSIWLAKAKEEKNTERKLLFYFIGMSAWASSEPWNTSGRYCFCLILRFSHDRKYKYNSIYLVRHAYIADAPHLWIEYKLQPIDVLIRWKNISHQKNSD